MKINCGSSGNWNENKWEDSQICKGKKIKKCLPNECLIICLSIQIQSKESCLCKHDMNDGSFTYVCMNEFKKKS